MRKWLNCEFLRDKSPPIRYSFRISYWRAFIGSISVAFRDNKVGIKEIYTKQLGTDKYMWFSISTLNL
jgi:hypothetical protein